MSYGSILRGDIIQWNDSVFVLQLKSGLQVELNPRDIRKVVADDVKRQGVRGQKQVRTYQFKERGIYQVTTGHISAVPAADMGVTHAVGFRFSRLLGVGIGTGIESFDIADGNQFVPLYIEARGFLLKQNISPYYALRAGYGIAFRNPETNFTHVRGGSTFGMELGYRFGGHKPLNFFTGIGMQFQKAIYEYRSPWETHFRDVLQHRRTELKFGVIF